MLHFINEGNQVLDNRGFPIPDTVRKHLQNTLDNYDGDKTIEGYKRLNNLLSMELISYHELKRLKNFFDHYNGTDKSSEYILNGGDEMKMWVYNTLNTATKSTKVNKKLMPAKPNDNKDRQTKPKKPTSPKTQMDDFLKNESVVRKIIVISENQKKRLIEKH